MGNSTLSRYGVTNLHNPPHQSVKSSTVAPPGYEDTRPTLEGQDSPQEPTQGTHAWKPGQEVLYRGKIYDIIAISDKGVYLGYVNSGVSTTQHYVTLPDNKLRPSK